MTLTTIADKNKYVAYTYTSFLETVEKFPRETKIRMNHECGINNDKIGGRV